MRFITEERGLHCCDWKCSDCSRMDPSACTGCSADGAVWKGGECVCDNGTYTRSQPAGSDVICDSCQIGCALCTSNADCKECADGYSLFENSCIDCGPA